VSNAAINIGMQVSLFYVDLLSSGYMPKSGITGSYTSSVFSLLRNLHTDFYSGNTDIHPHQQMATFVVVCVLDDSHSDWTEMKFQYCFDLHFLYGFSQLFFNSIFLILCLFDISSQLN
jgi:hypothetical protein